MTQRVSRSSGHFPRPRNRRSILLSSALLALMVIVAMALSACSSQVPNPAPTTTTAPTTAAPATTTPPPATSGKLEIKDLKVGTGTTAKTGDEITVDYTGWLMDGTKFDSSLDRKQPFSFKLGGGQVIAGWDQGFNGMKVGGSRELIIPPDLGYGPQGTPDGTIPANATLKFDVTLLKVNGKK